MNETYSTRIMFLSTDEQVSKLMDLGRETQDPTALQQHQMDSPINFDLGTVRESELQRKKTTESFTAATRSSIKTFRDIMKQVGPGTEIKLEVQRGSKLKGLKLKVADYPKVKAAK